jgi:hypothetical protein
MRHDEAAHAAVRHSSPEDINAFSRELISASNPVTLSIKDLNASNPAIWGLIIAILCSKMASGVLRKLIDPQSQAPLFRRAKPTASARNAFVVHFQQDELNIHCSYHNPRDQPLIRSDCFKCKSCG